MNKIDTTQRLQALLKWKYNQDINYYWADIGGKSFVEYHMDRIVNECCDAWENSYATQYVMVLESRIKAGR